MIDLEKWVDDRFEQDKHKQELGISVQYRLLYAFYAVLAEEAQKVGVFEFKDMKKEDSNE